jgi:hypothetical protein
MKVPRQKADCSKRKLKKLALICRSSETRKFHYTFNEYFIRIKFQFHPSSQIDMKREAECTPVLKITYSFRCGACSKAESLHLLHSVAFRLCPTVRAFRFYLLPYQSLIYSRGVYM